MEHYIVEEDNGKNSVFIFVPNFLEGKELSKMKTELLGIDDWKVTTKYDKKTIQRKQKWYQIDNQSFGKNWKEHHEQWRSHIYSEYLQSFQNKIQESVITIMSKYDDISNISFDSLLINYYENGNNCIAAHQDDKSSFGLEPTVALLSIGGPRTFCLERTISDSLKRDKEKCHLNKDFILPDNSLFIMAGSSQRNFCHSIKQEPDIMNSRYSLTFRKFLI